MTDTNKTMMTPIEVAELVTMRTFPTLISIVIICTIFAYALYRKKLVTKHLPIFFLTVLINFVIQIAVANASKLAIVLGYSFGVVPVYFFYKLNEQTKKEVLYDTKKLFVRGYIISFVITLLFYGMGLEFLFFAMPFCVFLALLMLWLCVEVF